MLDVITIKDVKLKIGGQCKTLRKANGLSRNELATALAVSSTTIQNIENGKNATLDSLLKVANHFGALDAIVTAIDKNNTVPNDISFY